MIATLTPNERKLLSEKDVETVYGLGRPLLRKQRLMGDGPPYLKIGRLVRYRALDLEAYLAAHRIDTTPKVN